MKVRNSEHLEIQEPSWKILGVLLCLTLVIVIIGIPFPFGPRPTPQSVSVSQSAGNVNVIVTAGVESVLDASMPATASSTAFDVLRAAAELQNVALEYKVYPGMGVLVTQIGNGKNGDGGAYWQYWVNGAYAQVAADQMAVKAGDKIEWKLAASEQ